MKLVFLFALFAIAYASDMQTMFQNWRVENKKFYASAGEYQKRFNIFSENVKRIEEFNADKTRTFTVGLNYFADLENSEYRAMYLTEMPLVQETDNAPVHNIKNVKAPASVDWRQQGYVNSVKDQGQCGSCFAFGAVASMEGAWAMAGHSLARFSEQQILDCSWSTGNQGCNGGWHHWAMDYVISNGGIDSEASYPYTASASRTCKYNAANVAGKIDSRVSVAATEAALQDAVAQAVVGVAIDAGKWSFQMYKSGVYNEPTCSSTGLNHAVAAVGYGTSTADYWIVRNSWGSSWGDQGYILMSRNKNNQCGIAARTYYAVAK